MKGPASDRQASTARWSRKTVLCRAPVPPCWQSVVCSLLNEIQQPCLFCTHTAYHAADGCHGAASRDNNVVVLVGERARELLAQRHWSLDVERPLFILYMILLRLGAGTLSEHACKDNVTLFESSLNQEHSKLVAYRPYQCSILRGRYLQFKRLNCNNLRPRLKFIHRCKPVTNSTRILKNANTLWTISYKWDLIPLPCLASACHSPL